MPAIKKGWKDNGKDVHFFWGLAGKNISTIKQCIDWGLEWWYVDNGYITEQITRYPEPIINNYDKTYFRICKGGIHTTSFKEHDDKRLNTEFKGWQSGEHILVCPSSPTVTYYINDMTQDDWIKETTDEIKKCTDRPIKLRNKPRPNNKWWNTDILDDLKDAHCLVTNMSLTAVDATVNGVPCITHNRNVAAGVSSRDISYKTLNYPFKPDGDKINRWMRMLSYNQFTIKEIENGIAFEVLQEQI
jgi:hypothetical protein